MVCRETKDLPATSLLTNKRVNSAFLVVAKMRPQSLWSIRNAVLTGPAKNELCLHSRARGEGVLSELKKRARPNPRSRMQAQPFCRVSRGGISDAPQALRTKFSIDQKRRVDTFVCEKACSWKIFRFPTYHYKRELSGLGDVRPW